MDGWINTTIIIRNHHIAVVSINAQAFRWNENIEAWQQSLINSGSVVFMATPVTMVKSGWHI